MGIGLAVQFFTLRDYTETPEAFDAALAKVASIGYRAVQLSAVKCMGGDRPLLDASGAREMLDRHGLRCVATHRPWGALRDQTEAELAFHQTLGCDYAAVGWLANDFPNTAAGYRAFLGECQHVLPKLKDGGLRFGYHNHSHEWVRDEGRPCYEILIEEGGPLLELEIDTYWAAHAGVEPSRLLRRTAGRIAMLHAKDMEVVANEGPVMAPVGEGNLAWDDIIAAARGGGTEWLIVEQDVCRRDPFDCLASSYAYLSKKL